MNLKWVKCDDGNWCPLETLDLSYVNASGVYVIWPDGYPARAVYVGQGNIASRLTDHRNDPTITRYGQFGVLYATWALVSVPYWDGVERYLADQLTPLEGTMHPNVTPIRVNLPQ